MFGGLPQDIGWSVVSAMVSDITSMLGGWSVLVVIVPVACWAPCLDIPMTT